MHGMPPSQDSVVGFSTRPACPYQGTNPALSRYPSTPSISFVHTLPSVSLLLSPTACLQPMHMTSLILLSYQPTTHTPKTSLPCASISAQLALSRGELSHSSPAFTWVMLIVWKSQWELMGSVPRPLLFLSWLFNEVHGFITQKIQFFIIQVFAWLKTMCALKCAVIFHS
jgi:hypothetical protein